MTSFSHLCLLLSSFVAVLNAAVVGDLVRLKGLKFDTKYNGKIGLVERSENDSMCVKVFMDDAFTSPPEDFFRSEDLSSFFDYRRFVPEKMEVIKRSDWKPELCAMFSMLSDDSFDFEHCKRILKAQLPPDIFNRLEVVSLRLIQFGILDGSMEPSEELKIIGAWMNQTFQASFLTSFPRF